MFQTKGIEEIIKGLLGSKHFSENRPFYEIMWKNIVEPDIPQMTRKYVPCTFHAR